MKVGKNVTIPVEFDFEEAQALIKVKNMLMLLTNQMNKRECNTAEWTYYDESGVFTLEELEDLIDTLDNIGDIDCIY